MEPVRIDLDSEDAVDDDVATHAALNEGDAAIARGEVVTLEQSNINLRKRLEAWRKAQQEVLATS